MDFRTGMDQLFQWLGEFLEEFDNLNFSFDFGTGAAAVAAYILM